jgi:hypothetical protein
MEEAGARAQPLREVAGDLVAVEMRVARVPAADEGHDGDSGSGEDRQSGDQRFHGVAACQSDGAVVGEVLGETRGGRNAAETRRERRGRLGAGGDPNLQAERLAEGTGEWRRFRRGAFDGDPDNSGGPRGAQEA